MSDSNCTRALPLALVLSPAFILRNPLCQKIEAVQFALHCLCCHGALTLTIALPQGILVNTDEEKVK